MTRIALHSDLHLERQPLPDGWLKDIPDILILAGDIVRIDKSYPLLLDLAAKHPSMQIVYVTGNHEYYDIEDMLEADQILKRNLQSHDRIHFLQKGTVEINGIRFLGATGWSRMLSLGKQKQDEAIRVVDHAIQDFRRIGYAGRMFTAQDCVDVAEEQYAWLKAELSKQTVCQTTVVVTHFSPSLQLRNMKFPLDLFSAYFHETFDELIKTYQPDLWMFGHTHANYDIHIGKTRVMSNQKGYGKECMPSYRPDWVIEL